MAGLVDQLGDSARPTLTDGDRDRQAQAQRRHMEEAKRTAAEHRKVWAHLDKKIRQVTGRSTFPARADYEDGGSGVQRWTSATIILEGKLEFWAHYDHYGKRVSVYVRPVGREGVKYEITQSIDAGDLGRQVIRWGL